MIAGLPYDAEVEYLESTGTQQIDTGVIVNDNNFVLTIDMCSMTAGQSVAWSNYFGSYSGESYMSTRLINNNKNANALYCGYRRRSNGQNFIAGNYFVATDRFKYILEYMKITVVRPRFNDWVITLNQPEGLEDTSTVKLFGANMRCWAFDITHDGEPIISFKPVRFTNELGQSEGAMYDRVSRKLFRNAGTGAFTIGPDVATPVMGLHFMPKPPPYDAKVEYLESTGTQYIDTGIPLTFPVSVDLSLAMVSPYGTSSSLPIFGYRANYGGARVAIWFTPGNKMYALNYGSYDSSYVLPYTTDGQKVSLAIQNGARLYLDGTPIADGGSPTTQDDTGTILLFQMRDTNKAPASRGQCLRLFSCRFYKSGECVRDLIPVRFTNELGQSEGAMYDNVSKQLFRNQGTGAFLWAEKQ